MELLQKFAAVEIQTDRRITETDKDYCERHQKAYEAAISSFQELAFFWEDMNKVQQELLGGKAILVVAGAPACTPELEAQGIANFIHVKSNVLETLKFYLKEMGI